MAPSEDRLGDDKPRYWWQGHLNASDAAILLGITTRQLRNLVESGLPKHGRGKDSYYVWKEIFAWYAPYKVYLATGVPPHKQDWDDNPWIASQIRSLAFKLSRWR